MEFLSKKKCGQQTTISILNLWKLGRPQQFGFMFHKSLILGIWKQSLFAKRVSVRFQHCTFFFWKIGKSLRIHWWMIPSCSSSRGAWHLFNGLKKTQIHWKLDRLRLVVLIVFTFVKGGFLSSLNWLSYDYHLIISNLIWGMFGDFFFQSNPTKVRQFAYISGRCHSGPTRIEMKRITLCLKIFCYYFLRHLDFFAAFLREMTFWVTKFTQEPHLFFAGFKWDLSKPWYGSSWIDDLLIFCCEVAWDCIRLRFPVGYGMHPFLFGGGKMILLTRFVVIPSWKVCGHTKEIVSFSKHHSGHRSNRVFHILPV